MKNDREWNIKEQVAQAKTSFDKLDPWVKSASHFSGSEKSTLSSEVAKAAAHKASKSK